MTEKIETKYLELSEIAKKFGVTKSCVISNLKRGSFGKDYIKRGNAYLVNEKKIFEIEEFFRTHVRFKEIDNEILSRYSKKRLMDKHLIQSYFPRAVLCNIFYYEAWYIPNADLVDFDITNHPVLKESKSVRNDSEQFNPYNYFDELTESIDQTFCSETAMLFREFCFTKYSDSRNKSIKKLVQKHANAITRLSNLLSKEVFQYNDDEIQLLLIDQSLRLDDKRILSVFINYLLGRYREKCNYKNSYNKHSLESKSEDSKIYTIEEWMDITNYLTNIDIHIKKAFTDPTYAKRWLYCILHLTIAWRYNDILEIKPIEAIEEVKIYNLEWFEKNQFTMTMAQNIINKIKILVKPITASKNGIKTHFIVYPYLIIPVSIAFITAQYHLSRNGISPRNIFNQGSFQTRDLNYFFEGTGLPEFSNLKANRSLITHNFNMSVMTDGMADISYSLSTFLRSHKLKSDYELSDTTTQYIYATNTDGSPENMALQLFRRGEFGWLYNSIIKIATSERKLSLEDMTSSIEMIKDVYSPVAIENLAAYLLVDFNERNKIINELLSKPKNEIWNILFALNRGEMPSKEDFIDCLMYDGLNHRCEKNYISNCLGCQYKIPTNYMLTTVSNKLQELISKLEQTEEIDYTQRQRYTFLIVKLLGILNEAKKQFNNWGEDYVSSFLNLEVVKEKIQYLEKNKFLVVTEGNKI